MGGGPTRRVWATDQSEGRVVDPMAPVSGRTDVGVWEGEREWIPEKKTGKERVREKKKESRKHMDEFKAWSSDGSSDAS